MSTFNFLEPIQILKDHRNTFLYQTRFLEIRTLCWFLIIAMALLTK